jgi:ABC-type branched-subunit amino acid transport system ATPase component
MLAIGRALMARPRVLLDEPSMGLAPTMVEVIFQTIQEINRQGTTILLVEQNALMALEVAQRGYVLQTGRAVLHDTAANLLQNTWSARCISASNDLSTLTPTIAHATRVQPFDSTLPSAI